MTAAERNYLVTEQELLAIVEALCVFRCYLLSGQQCDLVTDNRPNRFLQTQPILSRRQACWSEYLQRFHFNWVHRPGRRNVAGLLSRNPDIVALHALLAVMTRSAAGVMLVYLQVVQTLCQIANAENWILACRMLLLALRPPMQQTQQLSLQLTVLLRQAMQLTLMMCTTLLLLMTLLRHMLQIHSSRMRTTLQACPSLKVFGGRKVALSCQIRLTPSDWSSKLCMVILWLAIWKSPRQSRPLTAVSTGGVHIRRYLTTFVTAPVANCNPNPDPSKPTGLLQPLDVPSFAWHTVTTDYMTGLPVTADGHNAIAVFVDKLTKYVYAVPCNDTSDVVDWADMYVQHVVQHEGLSHVIISDRGPQFHNKCNVALSTCLGISWRLSTARHPQTDGQTERVNRVIEDVLRHFVSPNMTDWDRCLAQFAINNAWHETVQQTPFFLNHGRAAKAPLDILLLRRENVDNPSLQMICSGWLHVHKSSPLQHNKGKCAIMMLSMLMLCSLSMTCCSCPRKV